MNQLKSLFLIASALTIGLFVGVGHSAEQSTVPSTQAIFESIGYKLTLSGKVSVTVTLPFAQQPVLVTKTISVPVDSGSFELGFNRSLGQRSLDSGLLRTLLGVDSTLAVSASNAIQPFLTNLSNLGFQVPNAALS